MGADRDARVLPLRRQHAEAVALRVLSGCPDVPGGTCAGPGPDADLPGHAGRCREAAGRDRILPGTCQRLAAAVAGWPPTARTPRRHVAGDTHLPRLLMPRSFAALLAACVLTAACDGPTAPASEGAANPAIRHGASSPVERRS